MHRVVAALLMAGIAESGLAQTVLKREPLYLAPYRSAYVYDASCRSGMAKVTGSMRGLPRKKVCQQSSTLEQALPLGAQDLVAP